jgi:Flp pilus assembly protein TadD
LDDAIVMLAPLRQSADPYAGYVASLLTAEALRRNGHGAEAMGAYRQALTFAPNAMSASLGLSSVLAASGDIDGAIAAIKGAATTAAPVDPWRVFAYGSGRQWPRWRDALRQEMRR